MYIMNVDGYEGEREFFSKFGLEIRNNMSVIVSKRSFSRWVPQTYIRPREGDLLYVPFLSQAGEMYEIRYVNYSDSFYVLGNKYPYFYKLELEKFKYSQETIDVGIPEIDDLVSQEAYQIELTMNTATGNGNFEKGESVHNTANSVYGTVTSWNRPNGILKVTDIYGTFANNMLLRGNTSNASYTTSASPDELKDNLDREEYDNKLIQTEANTIIDFSESNPFGSIT
jgi:hypothetical protein